MRMADSTPIWRQFPHSFRAANIMEILERMSRCGFYAVSTLYLTNCIADGGLGFSFCDRGVTQGLAASFSVSSQSSLGPSPTVSVTGESLWRRAARRHLGTVRGASHHNHSRPRSV